jgi:membrane-associated phospholipid phosphatase
MMFNRLSSPGHACGIISTVFAGTYWFANHLTSLRSNIGTGVFDWERSIPFVTWTIVPYLSICCFFPMSFFVGRDPIELRRHVTRLALVLLVSVVCYAMFPLRFTFDRPPVEGVFSPLYGALAAFDLPYNRAPSLHIAVLVVLWARLGSGLNRVQRTCLGGWFLLIGASVLTTCQHHVIDVLAGLTLGATAVALTSSRAGKPTPNARRRVGGVLLAKNHRGDTHSSGVVAKTVRAEMHNAPSCGHRVTTK